nr:hypothetical protein [Tanacetum cinerariifolium]
MDFVKASHIRYALTLNPTVYVSYIRQFWSTARIETTKEGTKILATVDGKLRTVSESSIRRNLKLNDEAGISSLPDAELFENLQLMGYNILPNQKFAFQKGQFSHQWKYLIHTIMQCMSPKSTRFNEFSSNIVTALASVLPPVADEPASPLGDDSQGEACPTNSGFEADQDRENIAKTSTSPSDLTLRVTSLAADKDNKGVVDQSVDDAPIKGRSLYEGEEAAERVSDDTEEMETVLMSMDATSILTSKGVQVVPTAAEVATATVSIPTGSGVVSTASLSISTAAPIFTTATESTLYSRRKGKETMVESETPKKKKVQEKIDAQLVKELEEQMVREDQRMSEQIASDAEVARIHAEEELQMMINSLDRSNETVVKYVQEYEQILEDLSIGERIELICDLQKKDYYMAVIKGYAGWKTKDFKGMSFEQIKAKFNTVWKQIEDFIPMGSKEETERLKRKGLRLKQESAKKLKTSKEVPEEVKPSDEVPEEKVKEMMQLVPVDEIYVEALQVKHPIIDWKVHTKGQRSYWKIIRLGGSSASYQYFVDMLKHLDREDLNQLWRLVKEFLSIRPATIDKEMEL